MARMTLGTRNVSIEFPGVKALNDVNFEVSTGEIRALVGANGAGKSTLMKVLAGANPDYTGEVYLNGETVELRTTMAAKKLGIQIVYQEVDMALVPTLSVAENVMLGDMILTADKKPLVSWPEMRRRAKEVLDRLHINVNVRTLVQDLSLAQKQMVLIARAIVNKCNFLILDEPTAPLSDSETAELFRLVRHLQETENIAIIFISHRIHEILQICQKYTVMRNGEIVDTSDVTDKTTTREIIEKMLGRSFEENFPKETVPIGEKVFEVSHLSGADGSVPGLANVEPKGYVRMWKAAQEGDWTTVKAEQDRLNEISHIFDVTKGLVGYAGGVGAFKTALWLMGIFDSNTMPRPVKAMEGENVEAIKKVLEDNGLL